MRKGREIVGLPVISLATGKEVGVVQDLLLSPRTHKVTYLVVGEAGFLRRTCFISFQNVVNVGDNAVTISSESLLEKDRETGGSASTSQLSGSEVLTVDGKNLGTLEDVVVSIPEGKLLGYEISAGLVEDVISGRGVLSPGDILTWGKEAIIVRNIIEEPRRENDAVSHLSE